MIKIKKETDMDFLKIGKSKLKVSLTPEDIRKYKLTDVDADTDLAIHKRTFFRIIDIAERQVGFSPKSDKLLLQFYPGRDGGGELFVTRLSILTEAKRNIISKAENLSTLMRGRRAYFFDSVADATALARSIAARTEPPKSSALYITESGSAVIEIEEITAGDSSDEYHELCEFSDRLTAEFFLYLREHSITVFEDDAIRQLAALGQDA